MKYTIFFLPWSSFSLAETPHLVVRADKHNPHVLPDWSKMPTFEVSQPPIFPLNHKEPILFTIIFIFSSFANADNLTCSADISNSGEENHGVLISSHVKATCINKDTDDRYKLVMDGVGLHFILLH